VEPKLDERLLLVAVELAENLGCVEEVLVFEDPIPKMSITIPSMPRKDPPSFSSRGGVGVRLYALLPVIRQQRQIQQQRQPIPIDQKQYRQESVHARFGDDVHVEAVAQVDRVDVVAFEVRVHDGKEDL